MAYTQTSYRVVSSAYISAPGMLAYIRQLWHDGSHEAAVRAAAAMFVDAPAGLMAGWLVGEIEPTHEGDGPHGPDAVFIYPNT